MAKMNNGKPHSAMTKVTGLKAKSVTNFAAGKDHKSVITGLKANGAGIEMPASKGAKAKPMMKAKSVSKMG